MSMHIQLERGDVVILKTDYIDEKGGYYEAKTAFKVVDKVQGWLCCRPLSDRSVIMKGDCILMPPNPKLIEKATVAYRVLFE